MTRFYKAITADGVEHPDLSEETLRLWRDQGRINEESIVFDVAADHWRRLDQLFDLTQWSAPPSLEAPRFQPPPIINIDAPQIQSGQNEMKKPPATSVGGAVPTITGGIAKKTREPIGGWDFAIIIAMGIGLFILSVSGGSKFKDGAEACGGFIGTTIFPAIIYLPLRSKLSRSKSVIWAICLFIVISILIAIFVGIISNQTRQKALKQKQEIAEKAKTARNAPIELTNRMVDEHISIMSPKEFKVEYIQKKNPSIKESIAYSSSSPRISININKITFIKGYYYNSSSGLQGILDMYREKAVTFNMISGPTKIYTNGIPAMRADFDVSFSSNSGSENGRVSILTIGYPFNVNEPKTGISVIITAESMDPEREQLEIERIINSINFY